MPHVELGFQACLAATGVSECAACRPIHSFSPWHRCSGSCSAIRWRAAWTRTVAETAALQTAFVDESGIPIGMQLTSSGIALTTGLPAPGSLAEWLEADRRLPLLAPHTVPWRAVYWAGSRRFVWTFHHALLDGRSIARVLRGFLARLAGATADPLGLAHWQQPESAEIAAASRFFQSMEAPQGEIFAAAATPGAAIRRLGADFLTRLEMCAAEQNVTAATAVTWAWGQAMTAVTETPTVLVEQVRAGSPQPGTAGFTMHTLPVGITRCGDDPQENWAAIRDLRATLLAMREFETVSPDDFPDGGFPDLGHPAVSVVMVERGTLRWQIGAGGPAGPAASVALHESPGQSQLAAAYLQPDFQLHVEGPAKRALLAGWAAAICGLVSGRPL